MMTSSRIVASLFVLALLAVLTASCGPSILTPPTGPGTSYPCGTQGQQCSSGDCCLGPEYEDCGGDVPNCPAGMCCSNGCNASGDIFAGCAKAPVSSTSSTEAPKPKTYASMHPQTKPKSQ
jgi:hypothetical protein